MFIEKYSGEDRRPSGKAVTGVSYSGSTPLSKSDSEGSIPSTPAEKLACSSWLVVTLEANS